MEECSFIKVASFIQEKTGKQWTILKYGSFHEIRRNTDKFVITTFNELIGPLTRETFA